MIKAVLVEPEIPPNTGNIARLCAAFGVELHLVEPLGFKLENRYLKRAGLDYWPNVKMTVWSDWKQFLKLNQERDSGRLIMATTRAPTSLADFRFEKDDNIIFGPETRGLSDTVLAESSFHIRIPTLNMTEGGVRSLNLSTAAGIIIYTALADSNLLPK